MTSPGETTEKTDTTRPTRPRPSISSDEKKDDGGKKINPLAIIVPIVGFVSGVGTVLAVTMIKKKKK